jgi:hypothetical protein
VSRHSAAIAIRHSLHGTAASTSIMQQLSARGHPTGAPRCPSSKNAITPQRRNAGYRWGQRTWDVLLHARCAPQLGSSSSSRSSSSSGGGSGDGSVSVSVSVSGGSPSVSGSSSSACQTVVRQASAAELAQVARLRAEAYYAVGGPPTPPLQQQQRHRKPPTQCTRPPRAAPTAHPTPGRAAAAHPPPACCAAGRPLTIR